MPPADTPEKPSCCTPRWACPICPPSPREVADEVHAGRPARGHPRILGGRGMTTRTVADLLAAARSRLDRPDPRRAADLVQRGAILVDTRPGWQREQEGELPGALLIERNHLEWRLDPTSDAHLPQATDHDVTWIVVCSEGYSSSLAAASLQDIGLRHATDLDGGYQAWKRAFGSPVR